MAGTVNRCGVVVAVDVTTQAVIVGIGVGVVVVLNIVAVVHVATIKWYTRMCLRTVAETRQRQFSAFVMKPALAGETDLSTPSPEGGGMAE